MVEDQGNKVDDIVEVATQWDKKMAGSCYKVDFDVLRKYLFYLNFSLGDVAQSALLSTCACC